MTRTGWVAMYGMGVVVVFYLFVRGGMNLEHIVGKRVADSIVNLQLPPCDPNLYGPKNRWKNGHFDWSQSRISTRIFIFLAHNHLKLDNWGKPRPEMDSATSR